jgi:hypothetical protein
LPVGRVEVLVLVGNVVDRLSSDPDYVEGEWFAPPEGDVTMSAAAGHERLRATGRFEGGHLRDGGGRRGAVRALAEQRLSEIEQKLTELSRMRNTLRHLIHQCHGDGPLAGCPIIEAVLPVETTAATPQRVRRSA